MANQYYSDEQREEILRQIGGNNIAVNRELVNAPPEMKPPYPELPNPVIPDIFEQIGRISGYRRPPMYRSPVAVDGGAMPDAARVPSAIPVAVEEMLGPDMGKQDQSFVTGIEPIDTTGVGTPALDSILDFGGLLDWPSLREIGAEGFNILNELNPLRVKPAHGQSNTNMNVQSVNPPGTMLSRGVGNIWDAMTDDWSKPGPIAAWTDWATDGRGVQMPDPNLEDVFRPGVADWIRENPLWDMLNLPGQLVGHVAGVDMTGGGNPDPNPVTTADSLATRSLQSGADGHLKIKAYQEEQERKKTGMAWLWDMIQKAGRSDVANWMAAPEFVEGRFGETGLANVGGPLARGRVGFESREAERIAAEADYITAQAAANAVDPLSSTMKNVLDETQAAQQGLKITQLMRDIIDSGDDLTSWKMVKDRYGGRMASFMGVLSDQTNPQDLADAMGKLLMDRYMQATGQDKTNKAEITKMFRGFIDPTGAMKRDANLRSELDAMEAILQQKMTSGSRLLEREGLNLEGLQRPISLGSQEQDV